MILVAFFDHQIATTLLDYFIVLECRAFQVLSCTLNHTEVSAMKANHGEVRRKKRLVDFAVESGNVTKTCRYFGISRSSLYRWRNVYQEHGEDGLQGTRPIAKSHPNQTPNMVVEKILHVRRKYHLEPARITCYMVRYHQMRVSDATICRDLKRHGVH